MKYTLLLGDCLPLLRGMPCESVDSFVSDVPYGLGKEPTPEEILAYLQGDDLKTGDFMGADWDVPSVTVWKEVYRVLKPGAYVVCFGGTRTFDLISMGIRMAGFECRDTISHEFPDVVVPLPILQWVYGSGMPKSHNVGKAIDKVKGLERTEVVGVKPGHEEFANRGNNSSIVGLAESGTLAKGFSRPWMGDPEQVEKYHHQYAPASAEAAEWEGWGTGLKPAWEPILLFRKPFKGTIAKNVLEHGTGALNINATRVRHASKADFEQHKAQVDAVREKGGVRDNSWKNASDLSGANEVSTAGRWPANLVLTHSDLCCKTGIKTIAPHAQGPDRFQKTTGGDFSEAYGNQLADDSPEVMPEWACVEGCPVKEMNDQSGDRPSTLTGRADPNVAHGHPGTEMNPTSTFLGERTHLSQVYADAGGAARFFTQFECVDGCPVKELDTQSGPGHSHPREGDGEPLEYGDWHFKRVGGGHTDQGGASRFFEKFDGVPFRYIPKANRRESGIEIKHPTVKPLKLMRWLVKLVTRKGGIVLDPYCGSGSTLHAAVEEECGYIGIERDPGSFDEASRRMAIAQRKQERKDAFESLMAEADDE